jgi:hypothetical protein
VLLKFICPLTETLGSPFTIRLETEQLSGLIINCVLIEPPPELLNDPSISPVTEIVPPPVPLQGKLSKEIGQLQFSPVEVDVHPPDESG